MKFGGSFGSSWNRLAQGMADFGDKYAGTGQSMLTTFNKGYKQHRKAFLGKTLTKVGEGVWQATGVGPIAQGIAQYGYNKSRDLGTWDFSKPGGTTKRWGDTAEDQSMKASHHAFGTQYASAHQHGGGSSANVDSSSEDPSLINQGNWQRPDQISSFLRREQEMTLGRLHTDKTKGLPGRQSVKSLA